VCRTKIWAAAFGLAMVLAVQAQDCPSEGGKSGGCESGSCGQVSDDSCEMAGVLCSKDKGCAGACQTLCQRAYATLKAVKTEVGRLMKEEVGHECACAAGRCSSDDCGNCETLSEKVYKPLIKVSVIRRIKKGLKNQLFHVQKDEEGKESKVACTFLTEDVVCGTCALDLATVVWKNLKEAYRSSHR